MTKSELIETLCRRQPHLRHEDVVLSVTKLIETMVDALERDDRIEVRGFGSFSLHHRPARIGRNPRTGAPVQLPQRRVPHFKPGKELRERVSDVHPLDGDA